MYRLLVFDKSMPTGSTARSNNLPAAPFFTEARECGFTVNHDPLHPFLFFFLLPLRRARSGVRPVGLKPEVIKQKYAVRRK